MKAEPASAAQAAYEAFAETLRPGRPIAPWSTPSGRGALPGPAKNAWREAADAAFRWSAARASAKDEAREETTR